MLMFFKTKKITLIPCFVIEILKDKDLVDISLGLAFFFSFLLKLEEENILKSFICNTLLMHGDIEVKIYGD